MSFPSLQLDAAASPLSSAPSFFPLLLAFCFLFGYKSQDIIETGVGIKQHDLARLLLVPPRRPHWLRERKEDGEGSKGGHQRRESPDNSAACMHVFERLLFYASPIYLSFIQPLWGRWGDSRAHRQLALRKRHVNLLWELSNTVCQFMRAVPA